jgi:hypothetical protein
MAGHRGLPPLTFNGRRWSSDDLARMALGWLGALGERFRAGTEPTARLHASGWAHTGRHDLPRAAGRRRHHGLREGAGGRVLQPIAEQFPRLAYRAAREIALDTDAGSRRRITCSDDRVSVALDDPDHDDADGDPEQEMNPATERVRADHTESPHDERRHEE